MKKICFLFLLICLLFTYSQSMSVVCYVSNTGSDSNNGTSESTPWRTIAKVNSIMSSLPVGSQVLFKRGNVFEGTLNITKAGSALGYITFGSYGTGEPAEITGRKIITSWSLQPGNIYRASLSTSDTVSQVFINGKLMTLARYPDTGFLRTDASFGFTSFYDAQLMSFSENLIDANCRIRTANWQYETRIVSGYSAGNVTFSTPAVDSGFSDNGYYFDNKLDFLHSPGEWFYEKQTGYLYIIAPGNADPNTLNVEAVVQRKCIDVGLGIQYIKIQDLKITKSRFIGIDFYVGSNEVIQNCYISYAGTFAVRNNGLSNVIQNNVFEDNFSTAISGIMTKGLIKNNIVNRTALIPGLGASGWGGGVAFMQHLSQQTTIEGNKIDSTGHIAISIAKNNVVKNNVIDYSCLVLNDGGGIDVDDCDSLQILNNIVTNSIGNFETSKLKGSYASGIYINGALMKNTIIQGNTLCYNRYMGMHIDHKSGAVNNKITGNICYDNFISQLMMTDFSTTAFVPSFNTVIKNNVLYGLSSEQTCLEVRGHTSSGISDYGNFDSNFYFNPYSDFPIRRTQSYSGFYATNVYSFNYWKNTYSEDLNSVTDNLTFQQYKITDTIPGNLITNSNFNSNVNNWSTWPSGSTISHYTHPLLDGGSMRLTWNGTGYTESLTLSNGYSLTKGAFYVVSLSCVGNNTGAFNLWGRSSLNNSLATFPQTYFGYENYRKEHSFIYKADTTDPAATISIGMKLPDVLLYVDNVNLYKVNVSKIDSTQMSKIFINDNSAPAVFSLGNISYKDLNGNIVTGAVNVMPYSSVILINENQNLQLQNLQLTVLNEKFYRLNSNTTVRDTFKVYLRNSASPYLIADSSKSYCDTSGNCSAGFSAASDGIDYYLVVKHRNSIETWSKNPIRFNSGILNYDFTASQDKAYENNLILRGSRYCIYAGDVNQDGFVELEDYTLSDNGAKNYLQGYVREDINGDNFTDLSDLQAIDNNVFNYVSAHSP